MTYLLHGNWRFRSGTIILSKFWLWDPMFSMRSCLQVLSSNFWWIILYSPSNDCKSDLEPSSITETLLISQNLENWMIENSNWNLKSKDYVRLAPFYLNSPGLKLILKRFTLTQISNYQVLLLTLHLRHCQAQAGLLSEPFYNYCVKWNEVSIQKIVAIQTVEQSNMRFLLYFRL